MNPLTLSREERLELLEEAKKQLVQAIEHISDAVKDTDEDRRANAYIIPHLTDWLNNEPGSVEALITAISEMPGEEDDPEA